jgi:hypothetical protein
MWVTGQSVFEYRARHCDLRQLMSFSSTYCQVIMKHYGDLRRTKTGILNARMCVFFHNSDLFFI